MVLCFDWSMIRVIASVGWLELEVREIYVEFADHLRNLRMDLGCLWVIAL
jgi:hypothetical protein